MKELEEIKRICEEMKGSLQNGQNSQNYQYEASGNVSKARC